MSTEDPHGQRNKLHGQSHTGLKSVARRWNSLHHSIPPQANGIVERVNGVLGNIICKLVEHTGKDWDMLDLTAVFAYNISFHQTTGYSLFKLLFGREPATPSIAYPLITGQRPANTEEYVVRLARELIKLQTLAFDNLA